VNKFFEQIGKLLGQYSLRQRVVIIVIFIGILSAIISLVLWASRPEYEALYTDMDPSTAGKIVSDLKGMKIKYKIEHNGKTIYVPTEKIAELRLKFAESGYVGNTVSGYEIFDNAKIGMTTFMQRLNMKRALEGELVRTINQFSEVKNSRVHLVLPEEKLFEEEKNGSASVVLFLKQGKFLTEEQIKGIAALVSNSVKGIEPGNVVVVDANGSLLSDNQDKDNVLGSAGNQWDLRHKIEAKLQKKVKCIVENIVGSNNAVVEVSVDLNFEQIERTMETIDPDNIAVISEESNTESSFNSDTTQKTNEKHEKENIITNYELNKTVEHFLSNTGTIERLSIAVLVNGKNKLIKDDNGSEVKQYIPWSNRDLAQMEVLVKSAVGYKEERGDIVEIQNLQFDRSSLEKDKEYFANAEKRTMWASIVNKGIIGIGILAAFIIIRTLFKKASLTALPLASDAKTKTITERSSKPGMLAPEEGGDISEDIFIKKLSPEARAKIKAKDKMTSEVVNYAKSNPEDSAKLIRSWLTQKE